MGVKEKPHIITHLNGTIVVSKLHNYDFRWFRLARFESLHGCFGVH